jgi:hypothetical protein
MHGAESVQNKELGKTEEGSTPHAARPRDAVRGVPALAGKAAVFRICPTYVIGAGFFNVKGHLSFPKFSSTSS